VHLGKSITLETPLELAYNGEKGVRDATRARVAVGQDHTGSVDDLGGIGGTGFQKCRDTMADMGALQALTHPELFHGLPRLKCGQTHVVIARYEGVFT